MQDFIEKVQSLLLNNPWPLLFAIAVVVPIYGFKGRHFVRSLRANRLAGWSTRAKFGQTPHETGIGMREALILKPPRKFMLIGIFVMLAFGNLGWPYLVDPDLIWPPTRLKDVGLLASFVMFPVLGLFLIRFGFMRIVLVDNEIQHKRLFYRPVIYQLSALNTMKPAGSSIENGVWLEFSDHRRLRVMAFMSGYIDLMLLLSEPDTSVAEAVNVKRKQMHSEGQNNA